MRRGLRPILSRAASFLITALILVVLVFTALKAAGSPIAFPWIGRVLIGNFGQSTSNSEPVLSAILERLPATLELIVASLIIAATIGWILAVLSARAPTRVRPVVANLALPLQCIPFFWVAVVAQAFVGFHVRGPNPFGLAALDHFELRDWAMRLIFPALALAFVQINTLAEYLRSNPAATLHGLQKQVSIVAGLFNAFAQMLPEVIGGAVIIEVLFAWPGDGRMFFNGTGRADMSLLAGTVLFGALAVLVIRFVAAMAAGRKATNASAYDV